MQSLTIKDFIKDRDVDLTMTQVLGSLPMLYPDGPWLVGGTVRRFMVGEAPTTDFDIMFANQLQFDTFCGQMRERGAETKYSSDHQITFDWRGYGIQAICAVYSPTLIQTLQKLDFTICQFGFDGTTLVWGDDSYTDLQAKRLTFTDSEDPIASLRRAFKYTAQGFFMEQDDIVRFIRKLKGMDADSAEKKWLEFTPQDTKKNPYTGLSSGGKISATPKPGDLVTSSITADKLTVGTYTISASDIAQAPDIRREIEKLIQKSMDKNIKDLLKYGV